MNKVRNAIINIVMGFINKVITLLVPFIVRTIIIYFIGSEYLGLGSLFTSILNILSLAELGFSSAIVYSMYEPIANNNKEKICALLNLYKKIYKIIGVIVLVAGIMLIPFLKHFIKSDLPNDVNLYGLYCIYLSNTTLSYFLFAYRSSLFTAHQKTNFISLISTISHLILYICQIIAIILFKNYYLYTIFIPICTILNNLLTYFFSKSIYPDYFCYGEISEDEKKIIKGKVLALMGHKIGFGIVDSIDSVVVSAFLGLKILSIFSNYQYIITAIGGFLTIIYQSILGGIGNSIITKSKEKNYETFKTLTFLNWWIIMFCAACMVVLYQDFMNAWVGPDLMFDTKTAVLFSLSFLTVKIRMVTMTFKDAAGMWNADKLKPYVVCIMNIFLDILLVNYLGVDGIILSTIFVRYFIAFPWENIALNKYYFNQNIVKYFINSLILLLFSVISIGVTYYFCSFIKIENVYFKILIKLVLCIVFSNLIFAMLNIKNKEMKKTYYFIKKRRSGN